MRQDRPSDARKLVGQRNDGNVLVRPGQEPACPPAKRRLSLDEVRQHGSCAMDQVLAKITIATLADAQQARLAAGRHLARRQSEPRRHISSAPEGPGIANGGR